MDYDFDDDEGTPEGASDATERFDDTWGNQEESSLEEDAAYICNSCGEEIVIPVDHSGGPSQQYVEDCPVCCNPNEIFVELDPDGAPRVWSRSEQDQS